mgnify:CR=1 FL=1
MVKRMRSFLSAVMLMIAVTVSAQVTTASLSGKVTDENKEAIIGATVQAIHVPSGTHYGAITNTEGRYTIQGMRAGGPYKVEISYIGYQSEVFSDVQLSLGETLPLNATMKESSEVLGEVTVVGKAGVDANKTGAAMYLSSEKMAELPSLNHNVSDVVRMSPQVRVTDAGAMYFAGANNRYNSFQIDGAMNNDVFGLTSNGSNGGQAGVNPVSMETIDQIQVSVAPFDVRQSGFTGGSINAVTKSGTNEFHGSAYGYFQNYNLIGSKYKMVNGNDSEALGSQHDNTYGITLGGPIIKDKLFFFANYENTDKALTNVYGKGASASNVDGDVAQKILDKVIADAAAQGVTYNASLGNASDYTKSNKLGLKLDWNINQKHHASFRWSLVDGKSLNSTSSASSLVANSYSYDFKTKTNTLTFELQSRFNENINNEFHASYVRVRDQRDPSSPFPMIQIGNVGDGTLYLGNERSSMANKLDQDIYSITDNLTWYMGNHTLTAGTHNELYTFENLFIQDAYGTYIYSNVDDFYAGKVNRFRYGQANTDVTGDPRWAAKFSAGQLGFYVQDKWNVTDNFDLTYGLRMDMPLFLDTPVENEGFNADAAANGWDVKTNQKLSSSPMWSPRVGFRWNLDAKRNYVLRGGLGVFTGRVPFVWLSNNFSNTGIQTTSYSVYPTWNAQTGTSQVNGKDLQIIYNPNGQSVNLPASSAGTPSKSAQTVNVFDKDFKFAQTLRANLAFDARFAGIKWTFEGLYAKTLNDMMVENLNISATGKTFAEQYGLSFDNRPMYSKGDYSGIYKLVNTDGGYTWNLSAKAEKNFDFGLDMMASYTYTNSKTINNGTSSVAASNWQYNYTHGDPNHPELSTSAFNTPHQVMVSAYYHFGKTTERHSDVTTIGLIYQGTSGTPYTVYMNGDMNGDNGYNDLLFIPTDAQVDEMLAKGMFKATTAYTAEQQAANYKQWLGNENYMKDHRGEYFERYEANQNFVHRFDFHADRKFGFMVGKRMNYIQIAFDMLNVGNFFNTKWGRTYSTTSYYSPVTYSKGQYQFLHNGDFDMRSYSDFYSRWRAQISLKYSF